MSTLAPVAHAAMHTTAAAYAYETPVFLRPETEAPQAGRCGSAWRDDAGSGH